MADFAKAEFRTAYEQRAIVLDIVPATTVTAQVGDVVYVNNAGKLAVRATEASVAEGDFIIAQSDMTMGYGHIPVENRDYRYSKNVAMVADTKRKFILYPINELHDIITSLETRT